MAGTSASYDECWMWATHWAQHWFLDEAGEDRLLMDDLQAGWATQVDAFGVLLHVAFQAAGRESGGESAGLMARLKRRGLDRPIRSWGLRLATLSRSAPRAVRGEPILVTEIPTPSMVEPSIAVARALPDDGRNIAATDPRVLRTWRTAGFEPVPLLTDLRTQERSLRRGRTAAARLAAVVLADLPSMPLGSSDLRHQASEALATMLRHSLPWLFAEGSAVERVFEHVAPGSVAVASDQHRIGRLVHRSAARRGVHITVLQHGLPQSRIGFLPVIADTVAAWSGASVDWFVRFGTDASRLVITGNPRFDALSDATRSTAREAIDVKLGSTSSPRLLLALSPSARETNIGLLHCVLGALRRLPEARLIVKLHPGSRDWEFVAVGLRNERDLRDRVTVLHRDALTPLLQWAQVTLIHQSTVAIESLAAGTPVVLVVPDQASGPSPDILPGARLPLARDAVALADSVTELASDEGRRRQFDGEPGWIEHLVGPVDGRSSHRIAERLMQEAKERSSSR